MKHVKFLFVMLAVLSIDVTVVTAEEVNIEGECIVVDDFEENDCEVIEESDIDRETIAVETVDEDIDCIVDESGQISYTQIEAIDNVNGEMLESIIVDELEDSDYLVDIAGVRVLFEREETEDGLISIDVPEFETDDAGMNGEDIYTSASCINAYVIRNGNVIDRLCDVRESVQVECENQTLVIFAMIRQIDCMDNDECVTGTGYQEEQYGIEIESPKTISGDGLPSKYDNRKNMQPLRHQGTHKTCWAHTAVAMAEAYAKQNRLELNPDYSEAHLAYFMYEPVVDPLGGTEGDITVPGYREPECADWHVGGEVDMALMSLATWKGLATESEFPYKNVSKRISKDNAYKSAMHLSNIYKVDLTKNISDAKKLIKTCGAVGVSYNSDKPKFYNKKYNSYYCPVDMKTNHAVTIVGWDDNFSRNKFTKKPAGDGAWLVRNSLTNAKQGDNNYESYFGYFWMSYYDKGLSDTAYAAEYDLADKYDNNYQYDGGVYTEAVSDNTDCITVSNVFEAKASTAGEYLETVSFYTDTPDGEYGIEIYVNPKENDPESGVRIEGATTGGVFEYAGYHSVKLDQRVPLEYGDRFAVVVTIYATEYEANIGVETDYSSGKVNSYTNIGEGQSYIKYGQTWMDLADCISINKGNLRIKAYTVNNYGDVYSIKYRLNKGKNSPTNPSRYSGIKSVTLKNPRRTGYAFCGWYKDSKYKNRIKTIPQGTSGDITLYAKWKPIEYKIVFNQGCRGGGRMKPLAKRKYNKSYVLPRNRFKARGYEFVGWCTNKNGKGRIYRNGAKVKNLTTKDKDTVVLYAIWKKKKG